MANLTKTIKIEHFKSIRNIVLEDCRSINLFIGKPNVGKSNILEALTLFSLPYAKYISKKGLQQFIRCENEAELFYDGNTKENIQITVGDDVFLLSSVDNSHTNQFAGYINDKQVIEINKTNIRSVGNIAFTDIMHTDIKSYFFPAPFGFENTSIKFLQPATGCNLFSVLNVLPDIKSEIADILKGYGLRLSFDNATQQVKFWKELKSGEVFIVPFNSIADTMQRMIFYKTAIASNENSIITFEEPEAHSYPPYISKVTTDIIYSKTNQFFITTHSPYVVNDFIESDIDRLAIYLVDYKNGETLVKRLNDKELADVYEYGVDLFFNTEMFLD